MKITPISSTNLGAVATTSSSGTNSSAKEAAKQVFLGQTPTRMTQSDTPIDQQTDRIQRSIRRIKMRTNVSPDRPIETEVPTATPEQVFAPAAAQGATPDAVVQAETPVETRPISPQLAALAKARRALQVKESELKAREEALKAGPQGIAIDRLKAEPLRVLQEAGVTYEQLTEAILANPSSGPSAEIQALQAKIDALEKGVETKLSERDSQAEAQVVREIDKEATLKVASMDEYKYIKAMNKQKDVAELVHRTWKKTGEVLDTDEALMLINAECKKDYEKLVSQLTPAQAQQVAAQAQQAQAPIKTLTNRDTARPVIGRRERAMQAAMGLKK